MANEPHPILRNLEAQNPRKLQQKFDKIPFRINSKTNQTFTSKGELTEQLKNKIQQLKQLKKSNTPRNTRNAETTHKPKNGLQIRGPNQGNNFYRTDNANFISIQRKIKNMLECKSDPFGNILNLSKHYFSLNTYKLLNKNLNFPTPKQYGQKQLDTDTGNFFRLLKLRALFKDANHPQTADQLYPLFKTNQSGHLKKRITPSKLS